MLQRIGPAFVFSMVLLLYAMSSQAQPYGAIAYDAKTGAWGVAYNQGSQQSANQAAITACRERGAACEVVVRFWGELCGAYATGPKGAAGWGSGDSRYEAERNAYLACQRRGQGCQPRVWSCNAQSGGNEAFTPTEKCTFWDPDANSYVTRFCSSR